jgi:hypothetical protein
MSDRSIVNLEFLRKEAKALLKRCHFGDPQAIARIRAKLPHLASSDITARVEIKLADVQHVIAQELGYLNWANLKNQTSPLGGLDFSKPGSAGELPDDFRQWKWGVSYTVRPELFSHLVCGHEYRVGVSILRSRADGATFRGYGDLYERAHRIVSARAAALVCANDCHCFHTRILAHTWFRHGDTNLVRAAVTLGVTCLKTGETGSKGENQPTPEALAIPGGMTLEQAATSSNKMKGLDELYSDGDLREPGPNAVFTFSYGEYVEAVEGIDYKRLIRRAENLTVFHLQSLRNSARSEKLNIVKREWFYATSPDIAVVHIYVQT